MTLKAVFFDLDDTLLETTGTQALRAERVALRLQRELPALACGAFIERAIAKDPATGWALGVAALIEEAGLRDTEAGKEALKLWFFQGCEDLVRCFPGAEQVLRELTKDYLLGVITNGQERRQRAKFESLGIHELFRVFLTSERAGAEKPSAEIFLIALKEAGVTAAEAAFVGDRLDVDVFGARQAGMTAIWLDHQGRCPAGVGPEPDARILGFAELPDAVKSL